MSTFHIHDSCYLLPDRLNSHFLYCRVIKAFLSLLSYRLNKSNSSFLTPSGISPKPLILSVLLAPPCLQHPSQTGSPMPHAQTPWPRGDQTSWSAVRDSSKRSWLSLIYFSLNQDSTGRHQGKGAVTWTVTLVDVKVQQAFARGQQQPGTSSTVRTSHLTVPSASSR